MRSLTGPLALGALALSAFATVTSLGLARDVRAREGSAGPSPEALAALETRLGALELAVMLSTTGVGAPPPALPDAPRPPAPPPSSGTAATGLAPAPKPATTLADVERRLAEVERHVAAASVGPTAQTASPAVDLPAPPDAVSYLSSVADAERHFELTPAQKADLERVVADTAREREALHRVPAEDGKTWEDVEKECVRILGEGMIAYDGTKLGEFRERQIPGRGESFGAADRRLTDEARRRLEQSLTPSQREKLSKTNVDSLVGGGGSGGISLSFSAGGFSLPVPQPEGGK